MGRSLIPERLDFSHTLLFSVSLWGISPRFRGLSPAPGQISYVLLTRAPLSAQPKSGFPFDLHVLGTPPAFILSQDRTLRKIVLGSFRFHSSVVKVRATHNRRRGVDSPTTHRQNTNPILIRQVPLCVSRPFHAGIGDCATVQAGWRENVETLVPARLSYNDPA